MHRLIMCCLLKAYYLQLLEQLEMEPLEIDPLTDLRSYGLDSVGMVNLVGLWRANGANILYEDFLQDASLKALLEKLLE